MKPGSTRTAVLATLLSAIVPGFGQFLVGAWVRGAIWFTGWLVLAVVAGGAHNAAVMALMVIASIDAYVIARAHPRRRARRSRAPGAVADGPPS